VARDEKEAGDRALLNLGHTFGHALEALGGYDGRLLHGEAVSIGMCMAFDLSVRMSLCPASDLTRLKRHLDSCGLKTSVSQIEPALAGTPEQALSRMAHDKKNVSGILTFILAHGIGKAFRSDQVRSDDVLQSLRSGWV
jgi:3-dehydroquinate synthase